MRLETLKVRIVFTEPVLGTTPGNPELMRGFTEKRAPLEASVKEEHKLADEMFDPEEETQKLSTLFPRDDTGVFMWDYQIRGSIKETLGLLIEAGDITSPTKWTYKKAVDSYVFVKPRRIYLKDAAGEIIKKATEDLQRPLRADTPRGERICLARSEMLPVGTFIEFKVEAFCGTNSKSKWATITREKVISCLDFGQYKGLGQWRSGGYGRFEWQDMDVPAAPVLDEDLIEAVV